MGRFGQGPQTASYRYRIVAWELQYIAVEFRRHGVDEKFIFRFPGSLCRIEFKRLLGSVQDLFFNAIRLLKALFF